MVCEVIEVNRKGFLSKKLDAFDADLLVLLALFLALRAWPDILLEWLTEFVDTVFLSRFISLHHNNLLKRQWKSVMIFKFSVI